MQSRFAILFLTSLHLWGSGFYGNGTSARVLGMGGIYSPSTSGALDSIAQNPAGLALLNAPTIDLSLASMFARGSFSNSVNRDVRMSNSGVMPYGAFGAPLGSSRLSFGVGIVPELMSSSDWQYTDAPGAAGASYGLTRHKSHIVAARTAAGVGAYLGPNLSIGATIGVVYNSNTLQAPYIFQSHPALKGLKTLLDLRTDGMGWNTSVGLIARPVRKVRLSAAWKSRTVIDSRGEASGNIGVQLTAAGLAARPDFQYAAHVRNILPQSVLASAAWEVTPRWRLALQTDWVNWASAFAQLPVSLTQGTNPDINGLLGTSSLADTVPLHWKDQFGVRAGVERLFLESSSIRAGYAHANNPVPSSTLSPLTAAILKDSLSAGIGHRVGKWRFDLGYSADLSSRATVRSSALQAGEYSNSTVRIGVHTLILSTSTQF